MGLVWASLGELLVSVVSLLSVFPRVQELALTIRPLRRCLLHNLRPQFVKLVEEATKCPPPLLTPEERGYYVEASDMSTLRMAALHALARSMEVNSHDPLPPTILLPTVSNILLQTDNPRGKRWLETVAEVLASQLEGTILPVDPFLLASFLHITLGGQGPEDHLHSRAGKTRPRTPLRNSNTDIDTDTDTGKDERLSRGHFVSSTKLRSRLAWEALGEALAVQNKPVVVFLRQADALLCKSWDVFETFEECFGPKTGVESVLDQRQLPHVPIIMIGGVVLEESGPSLVATKHVSSMEMSDDPFKGNALLDDAELSSSSMDSFTGMQSNMLLALMAAALVDDALSYPPHLRRPPPNPRKLLPRIFPTCLKLSSPPPDSPMAVVHNERLLHDVEEEVRRENYRTASMIAASSGISIPPQSSSVYLQHFGSSRARIDKESVIRKEEWEKVFAWAVSLCKSAAPQMSSPSSSDTALSPVVISEKAIEYGFSMVSRTKKSPRLAIQPGNSYEKQLLPEVVSPEDMCTSFHAIGALEDAKESLYEAVQLPLQRPYLFGSQTLIQPPTGVLLFGPPGTGKTLLARAVAAESGASFLELSSSILGSKWYGDSTKLVRAAFSLAEKLSPCVIFIDEVDALLGQRSGGSQEHEASRELKNEFFMRWDGLRSGSRYVSKNGDGKGPERRVMVLGATNRPFDLDEAVVRRFSVRVSVGVPTMKDRVKILKVILNGQGLDDEVDIHVIAEKTEGFTGSDLKQLCTCAAMRPIRELIVKDRSKSNGTFGLKLEAPDSIITAVKTLLDGDVDGDMGKEKQMQVPRNVNAADFEEALKEVRATVDPDSSSIQELSAWNAKYGTVGNRGPPPSARMSYFT